MKRLFPCWLLATAAVAFAYKEVPPPPKVVLPKPRPPAESLASIRVPADLEVELVAAEPMVRDPIDVSFGPDGRIWVVEMADYPQGMDGAGRPGGRIRFLESSKGDGRYDRSTLFAEGLRFPTSVVPWRGGVLVTAVPDLLLLEDTDGDGRADRTTRLFTGLGDGNQQHLSNGLQWSLDGWLHLANGNSGGKIVSAKTGKTVEVGQRDFRVRIDEGDVEVLAGATQAGRNRDDWGNWFGCNNSNPLWHFVLEDHYLRRNPHLVPPNATISLGAVPGAARVYPASETVARFNDPHGFNHFTSACGLMIYRDDFLGPAYAGNAFVGEPVHNLVHRALLRPAGVTFKADRAPTEQASEFFASTDNWSRFVAQRAGPDGALYIVDMYRLAIEHPKWIPDAWQKELGNLRAGENEGRIYRVKPKGAALRPVPRLDRADAPALVAALDHPSGTVRDLAHQLIFWRQDKGAAASLARLAAESARGATRAQALWALHSIGELSSEVVERALGDREAGVRRQAVRLSEPFAGRPAIVNRVAALAQDPDAAVRLQVAYSLGEFKDGSAAPALMRLLAPEEDRFVRAAAMSSVLPHADAILAQLSAGGAAHHALLVEIAAVTQNARALATMLASIGAAAEGAVGPRHFAALGQLLDWLQRSNKSLAQLQSTGGTEMSRALGAVDAVFAGARVTAVNPSAAVPERVAATQVLGRGRAQQNEDMELLVRLLAPQSPVEVQVAAVASLGRINRPAVPERLLAGWESYGRAVRAGVLGLLISRPAWAQVLLDQVEKNPSLLAQIDAGSRMALTQNSNARLAQRAGEIFNAGTNPDRQKVIQRYQAALTGRTGDATKGATVFTNVCSACHRFGDVPGRLVGPDLATVKDRSAPYLLTHILDPNRALEDKYILYTAATQDGRALAGMLGGEAGNSITLVGLDGMEQTVLRSELRSLVTTSRSLMPDGLEAAIDEQAMADLIAFLAGGGAAQK